MDSEEINSAAIGPMEQISKGLNQIDRHLSAIRVFQTQISEGLDSIRGALNLLQEKAPKAEYVQP